MADQIVFSINNDLAEIPRLNDVVTVFLARVWIPARAASIVDLAIEELATNIVKYCEDAHQIQVSLATTSDYLVIVTEDEGRPFNPLEVDEQATGAPLDESEAGKTGIDLIRNIAESIEYRRVDGKNQVEIRITMDVG